MCLSLPVYESIGILYILVSTWKVEMNRGSR